MPANFVPRDDLRDVLEELSAEFPIALLCAPAGYGKTLLLADWVDKRGAEDVAWVSMDPGDNDLGRFWAAVLNALCGCGAVPASSRLRELDPPDPTDTGGFLAEVIDTLAALPDPVYVVLDDVHVIMSDDTWHGLATIIRHQPANLRLVLSSRADPPLPLARLRVQGRLAELRAADLRFTHEQAAELLRLADVGLDAAQVRRLVDQTDGWPAGLRLAARSLRDVVDRDAFLAEFAGNDRSVADFLVNEVLARFPAATTDVLSLVSVCDEVTSTLAIRLTGREDAGAILAGLERDNSLVLGVGADRQWFRTHPLLRSYLQADLLRQRPDVVAGLHETARAWFTEQEQPDKAFDHVTLTGENRTTVALLHRYAASVLLAGDDPRSVRRALDNVGHDVVADDPELALISALAHIEAGESGAAEADLAASWAAWPVDPDAGLQRLRQLTLTTQALIHGGPPPVVPLAWRDVTAAYDGADLEAWARLCHGWTLLRTGAGAEARRELELAERLARQHGLDYVTMHALSMLGVLACAEGDLPTTDALCAAAVGVAGTHGWTTSPWLVANHIMLGLARLLRLDPAAALDEAALAMAALPEPVAPQFAYMIEVLTAASHFDTGRQHDGVRQMRDARRRLGNTNLPPPVLVAGALLEHRCALELGHDVQAIVRWTQVHAGDIAEVHLMQAATAFTYGDLAGTETALREVRRGSRPVLSPTTPLEARLLETALEIRKDRRTSALTALESALTLAEPAALIRPFHHTDVAVRGLLLELVGGFDEANGFVTRVSRAVSTIDNNGDGGLTHREHTVLTLLSSPQTIVEMATDLSVSVNTVKTHIRAIYTKLGVNNRRAAVVAGRHLGID